MAPDATLSTSQRSPALTSVDGRTYPLRSAHIRGRAEGGLAQTTLIQEFANRYEEPLEVLYTMPLPVDGAVLGYTIRIGERVIRGEIEPRDEAEAIYKEALYSGRTAGLLEEDRADTFRQRLGNVPPRTDVRVEIDVLHPLGFLVAVDEVGPLWEYRFPTVVGVRYEGAPGRVPDRERLDIDRDAAGGIPTRFDMNLVVADDVVAGGGISSPSHAVVCVANAVGTHVTLPEDARLDRDLVLRWPACADEPGVRVVEGGGLEGDDGRYALVTLTPPRVVAAAWKRDLTVLIDASGSMGGEPLETAKDVVADLLRSLEEGDRFEVLAFANKPWSLTRGMEKATPDSVERAVKAVRALSASGGTEMVDAFQEAMASLRRDSQRQIVLVTDGQIGFEDEVLERMGQRLPSGVRVHVVGIGRAVNRTLTSMVARKGRGLELIAGARGEAAECARRLRLATVRPVLTDVRIGSTAIEMDAVAPSAPRDVLAGQPLTVAVELKKVGGTIEVQAVQADGGERMWRIAVPDMAGTLSPALPRTPLAIGALYGREAIADVEARISVGTRENPDDIIEELGMRHRIVSSRTSLVAVAEEPSVDPLAPRRREKLALELPAGVSAEGTGLWRMGGFAMGMQETGVISKGLDLARMSLARPFIKGSGVFSMSPDALEDKQLDADAYDVTVRGDLLVAEGIHSYGSDLTMEIEVREDGFELPDGEITVVFEDRPSSKGRVVKEQSSPRGPHPRGTRVRLTVRLADGEGWPDQALTLEWTAKSKNDSVQVVRLIVIPPKFKAGG
ncbi:MAG TPA: VIT domain-containing protein [Tepidiformaceae bacterium]|nr:VIT domain-containing protein [Tepidiformaceae bacterium]